MAVQAQYPSNILLFNRNVQDSKNNNIILEQQQPCVGDFLEQSHMFFNHNGGVGVNNPRKRSREIATTATHTTTTTTVDSFNFSLQNQNRHQNHQLIDLSQQQQQQQQQHHPSFVSTGLKLSFGEQNQQQQQQKQKQQIQQQQQQQPALLTLFSDELAFQFKQQNDELNYFLHAQGEQLRRALSEKRQRHYTALLRSAEAAVARQVREKEVELDTVARRNAELEARAAQLNSEAQVWQARAQAQEAQAVSLQAQIQQAMNGPGPNNVVGPLQPERDADAEDAESVYDDPAAVEGRARSPCCKACRKRDASVVLLPCRHLCVCVQCDNIVQACPLCFSLRTASVEVYLT